MFVLTFVVVGSWHFCGPPFSAVMTTKRYIYTVVRDSLVFPVTILIVPLIFHCGMAGNQEAGYPAEIVKHRRNTFSFVPHFEWVLWASWVRFKYREYCLLNALGFRDLYSILILQLCFVIVRILKNY